MKFLNMKMLASCNSCEKKSKIFLLSRVSPEDGEILKSKERSLRKEKKKSCPKNRQQTYPSLATTIARLGLFLFLPYYNFITTIDRATIDFISTLQYITF